MTSEARIAANQANSKKSTGPKSVEGKARASLNSLKHGMRAEMVVLPTERNEDFTAHVNKWMSDWRPPTETRRWLVERAAISAWRCDRCVREESARLGDRVLKVLKDWSNKREFSVDTLMANFMEDPDASLRALLEIPEGLVRLLTICTRISDDLVDHTSWVDAEEHHGMFIRMFGLCEAAGNPQNYKDDPEGVDRFGIDSIIKQKALTIVQASEALLMYNCPEMADNPAIQRNCIDPVTIADRLRDILHDRMSAMEETLAEIDDRYTTRLKTAELIGLKPQKDDALYHRYEAHHEREVRANLTLLMKLEKTGDDLVGLSHAEEVRLASLPPEPAAITPTPAASPKQAVEPTPAVPAQVPNEAKPILAVSAQVPNEANVEPPCRPVSDRKAWPTGVVGLSGGSEMTRLPS